MLISLQLAHFVQELRRPSVAKFVGVYSCCSPLRLDADLLSRMTAFYLSKGLMGTAALSISPFLQRCRLARRKQYGYTSFPSR